MSDIHDPASGSKDLGTVNPFYTIASTSDPASALSSLVDTIPSTLRPSSNVPFRKDADYVERGDILDQIDMRCSKPAGRAALVGFGGFGKSQLAIEYAHRVKRSTPETWIFWVHASNSARLEEAFRDIAERVGLQFQPGAAANVYSLVCKWLCNETNGQWLMIVDNADEEIMVALQKDEKDSLASLLPQCDHGAILLTSRNADVARGIVGRQQDMIMVGAMSEDESVQLLYNKLGDGPCDGAAQLVQTLECIPLAIVQAAAYINRLGSRMSVRKYLSELEGAGRKVQLLQKETPDTRRDKKALNSVLATWQITFEHLVSKRPSAADLLSFMSFFNQQGIPEYMIRHYGDDTEGPNDIPTEDIVENVDFEEDVALLLSFSLIATAHNNDFEMHALVQLATRIWLKSTAADGRWHRAFIQAMAAEFPTNDFENWPKCQELFPHVLTEIEQHGLTAPRDSNRAELLYKASGYAWRQGLLTQAEKMILDALDIYKEVLSPGHHLILECSSLLCCILLDLGRPEETESLQKQTLIDYEKLVGPDHSWTLISMNNLIITLLDLGKLEESESLARKATAARQNLSGDDHPETLTVKNNLALVLNRRYKFEEAESLTRQVLSGYQKVFGAQHPETLVNMSNLALVLFGQEKFDEAEIVAQQVVSADLKVLGSDHLQTIKAISILASIYLKQGRYDEAEKMQLQELKSRREVLGINHRDTLTAMHNLGLVYQKQSRLEEAEKIQVEVTKIRQRRFGDDDRETLLSLENLALIYQIQGRLEDAQKIQESTLETQKTKLGDVHPATIRNVSNLAITYCKQGELIKAEELQTDVLQKGREILGSDHTTTMAIMSNLAMTYRDQGRLEEAEGLEVELLELRKTKLGINHPDTHISMHNTAYTWKYMGYDKDALHLLQECVKIRRDLGHDTPNTRASARWLAEWEEEAIKDASQGFELVHIVD